MESGGGDQRGYQTNQIVVHVTRVTEGRCTASHDSGYLMSSEEQQSIELVTH